MPDPISWLIDQIPGLPQPDPNKQSLITGPANDVHNKGGGGGGATLGQSAAPDVSAGVKSAATNALGASQGKGQAQPFVSPLALQMFFAQKIAPLLQHIQGNQSQAIDQFKAAGGQVDPRQLASMQNVNNAMAGAATAAPAVDALIGQLNQTLNAQQKAYYESLRAASLSSGGTDLTTQLQALLGSGAAPSGG